VLGTTGFARDITERKQVEQALLQQKNFIRQVIDTDPNMISVKNAEGKFLMVNKAMAAMHGMSPKELVGQSGAEQFRIKENFAPILQADREVIETLRRVELVTHDFRNGEERWFHITKVPMQQPDGTVHVLGIGVDITEKRLAEQQLHKLTTHLQTVREEEQTRIARDIHDDLGGTLTALKMETYGLDANCTGCKEATPMFGRVKAMAQLLDDAVSATRRVITELHPVILDDLGLQAALKWQAGQFHKRTGIECRVVCTQDEDCETELAKTHTINLFRIFQEALTNVTRHSGASSVEIEFTTGDEIILSIRDNGCGLPEGHTIASTSYGMRGMTERVKQLGGKIRFDSPPGGGLGITVKLPADHNKGA
jgi:PAS domain S-box-containing protein